jgi:diguanylate cyclase (GGDEF)-like protein
MQIPAEAVQIPGHSACWFVGNRLSRRKVLEACVRVRLIGRSDTSLAVALIVGAVIVFQQPLRRLLDLAHEIELRYQVDLLPALTILVVVFVFHQYDKRQQARVALGEVAADAAQARARSEELERLMTFGHSVANALEQQPLKEALWRGVPGFISDREFWILTREDDRWHGLLQDARGAKRRRLDTLEALADQVTADGLAARHEGVEVADAHGRSWCFPLTAGGTLVGVIGVADEPALTKSDRQAVAAAAALVAVAVRNVHVLQATRDTGIRDALTGCVLRTFALETLDGELRRSRRNGRPVSVLMMDIDNFKTINDTHGHQSGDAVLAAVGAQLAEVLRSTDVKCRYGGDEFLVILPETPALGAQQVAEALRRQIAELAIDPAVKVPVSASIGVAVSMPGELAVDALVRRADEALYEAKRGGRNRFALAMPPKAAAG